MDDWTNIRDVRAAGGGKALVRCQVESVRQKITKSGKPYYEIVLRDAGDSVSLKAWEDAPSFSVAAGLRAGEFLEVGGEWSTGAFGLECRDWLVRRLDDEEIAAVLAGSEAGRALQAEYWEDIVGFVAGMVDPRLRTLCQWFLDAYADRFRRCAAARDYHHARRGGLVEHVGQMMRSADAICGVYPALNRDLLLAGVLFHDAGKLWENCHAENSFSIPVTEYGELLGHIPIGMELVNRLWRELMENEEAADWRALEPASDQVRLHLLHLIASHHGEYQFGAPVLPRTPEAMVLHHVDNMDAKLEILFRGYENSPEVGRNVLERVRPLPTRIVRPLAHFHCVAGYDGEDEAKAAADPDGEPIPPA